MTASLSLCATALADENPPKELPDLVVGKAYFLKEEYLPGEEVTATITITNTGKAAAENVRFTRKSMTSWRYDSGWEKLDTDGSGVSIAPGASKTVTIKGAAENVDSSMTYVGTITATEPVDGGWQPVEAKPEDNHLNLNAAVVRTGGATVTIRRDNAPMPGVRVLLQGGVKGRQYDGRTDGSGAVVFEALPVGSYQSRFEDTAGLYIPADKVQVAPGETTEIELNAIAASRDVLGATIELDDFSYPAGSPITARITLTNRGTTELVGITTACAETELKNTLKGTGAGWDPLRAQDEGVNIPAGESTTVTVTDTVPDAAATLGTLGVSCAFGRRDEPVTTRSYATTGAGVDGVTGRATLRLFHDRNGNDAFDPGEQTPGVQSALTRPRTNDVVGRASTNSKGEVDFTGIAANFYQLRPIGPWRTVGLNVVEVINKDRARIDLEIEPGPFQPDPQPETAQPGSEAEQSNTSQSNTASRPAARRLASTGFDQPWLVLVGLGLISAGAALLMTRGRRGWN